MKTIIFILSIFIGSLIAEPVVSAAATTDNAIQLHEKIGDRKINKKSAKRYRTNRGMRRGAKTCLNKNGCKHTKAAHHYKKKSKKKCNF